MALRVAQERFAEYGRDGGRAAIAQRLDVGLTWRVLGKSVCGTSHERLGSRCQDACGYVAFDVEDGSVAVLALADGAGSAERSHLGSLAAVNAVVAFLRERLRARASTNDAGEEELETVRDAVAFARETVLAQAAELGVPLRELSCTLLVAVLTDAATYAAHIGDGASALDDGGGLRALTWPEQGEYANATAFLTDDDALERVRYIRAGAARRLALISDGLQSIALRYDEGTPYAGFFEPFFTHAETSDATDDEIVQQLERYLASETVSARTDDDKTLVLAVRR